MSRPIVWVLGCVALAAAATSYAGERLSRVTASAAVARAPHAPAPAVVGSIGPAERIVTVRADRTGNFGLPTTVDGRRIGMLVDTGATVVALTYEDAAAAGIRPAPSEYTAVLSTANGTVAGAPVRVREMRVGGIIVRDVQAVVMPKGRLGTSLLGMSFLRRLRSFEVADGQLSMRG